MPYTDFTPAEHGFKFKNLFNNHRFWIGGVHFNFGGRCGGMVYAALDHYWARPRRLPIPTSRELPPEGSVLSTYISVRQEQSTLNNIDRWLELILGQPARGAEFYGWGLQEAGGQAGVLKHEIDRHRPVALGLLSHSDAIKHHQVLAVGYDGAGEDLRIGVYDSNYPRELKVLRPFPARQIFGYDGTGEGEGLDCAKWRTYFVDLNYRRRQPYIHVREDGADYRGRDFQGHDLSRRDFRGVAATGANFTGATVTYTDFEVADLHFAKFRGANARHSSFQEADLQRADFYGADLKNATLIYARAPEATFYGADLKLVNAEGAHFEKAVFQGADLHRTVLRCVKASEANFYGANLSESDLYGADLRDANFEGADLRHADLRESILTGARLVGADLRAAQSGGAVDFPDHI